MRAGMMRHTAVVKRRASTVDAGGQPTTTSTTLATVRCSIEPLNGREYFEASGEGSTVDTRVRVHYQSALSDLAPQDWLEVSGKVYDITSVINPQMKNRELVIMCKVRDRD